MSSSCLEDDIESRNDIPLIDENELIDVSTMNFSDEDNWLCDTNQANPKTIQHQYVSVNSNLESEELYIPKGTRKSIDTRTYTRAKRRSNRPSVEGVLSNLASSTSPPWTGNPANFCSTPIPVRFTEHYGESATIPHMLRPNSNSYKFSNNNNSSASSGPESMEAFLNMSQSKGADSFINMPEPDFNDVLMNISQPSMLYSSLTTPAKDDMSLSTEILTNSMMQTSMFNEVKDVSMPFENENINATIIQTERTLINDNLSENEMDINDTSYPSLEGGRTITMNSTFNSEDQSNPKVDKNNPLEESDPLNNIYSKTVIELNASLPRNETHETSRRETFLIRHSTFDINSPPEVLNHISEHEVTPSPKRGQMNRTFDAVESSSPSPKQKVLNTTFDMANITNEEEKLNVTFEKEKPAASSETSDSTFDSKTTSLVEESLSTTFDMAKVTEAKQIEPPKPKMVTTLRQELLKEARRTENKCLDSTFDINCQKENYEKQLNLTYERNHDTQNTQKGSKLTEKNQLDRNLTFKVKNNNAYVKDEGDNLNSTFMKSEKQVVRKLQRRLPGPNIYSKAPSYLQKSNPNLISGSLNTVNSMEVAGKPSLLRYSRGSQPNIAANVKKSSLGRFKGGSDQRLKDVTHNISDFHIAATSGSTESIESTQSAHSAPDLDDRLSNCSENSSRGSYTIRRMDSDQLHKIAQLQEESLSYESTPKPSRHENNFMKNEDLPSPISKHESVGQEKDYKTKIRKNVFGTNSVTHNSLSTDSFIIAGAASKQTQMQAPTATLKKLEIPTKRQSKIAAPVETKSKLRQPTNFNSANRPLSAASGIPRPMSRIPAPKTTRPRTAQSDMKKGYL